MNNAVGSRNAFICMMRLASGMVSKNVCDYVVWQTEACHTILISEPKGYAGLWPRVTIGKPLRKRSASSRTTAWRIESFDIPLGSSTFRCQFSRPIVMCLHSLVYQEVHR
jgi:hypothetical protein